MDNDSWIYHFHHLSKMPAVEKPSLLPPQDTLTGVNSAQPTCVIHPFVGAGQYTRRFHKRTWPNRGKNTRRPPGLKLRLWGKLVVFGIQRPNRYTKGERRTLISVTSRMYSGAHKPPVEGANNGNCCHKLTGAMALGRPQGTQHGSVSIPGRSDSVRQ